MITDLYQDDDGFYVAIIDRQKLREIKTLEDALILYNRTIETPINKETL